MIIPIFQNFLKKSRECLHSLSAERTTINPIFTAFLYFEDVFCLRILYYNLNTIENETKQKCAGFRGELRGADDSLLDE